MWLRKKENIKKKPNLFFKRRCECLAILEVSNKIAFVLAKRYKPFSDGENIAKPCLHKITKWVVDESIERKVNEIAIPKQTITQHIEELSYVSEQQKDRVHTSSFFSLALDESANICDAVQLSFIISESDDILIILRNYWP